MSCGNAIIVTSVFVAVYTAFRWARREKCTPSEASADDSCQSLFYASQPGPNGTGFPFGTRIDESTIQGLKTVQPEYSRLPFDIYKQCVELLPIVCVDVICQRKSDGKLLLFYRKDKPAAGIWWWPGGRMFRGETFVDCAVRKIRDETGNPKVKLAAKGIVDVWNTFFPDSNWDDKRRPGYEGTQTVNICVCLQLDDTQSTDALVVSGAQSSWAVEDHRWVTPSDALREGAFDKYVSLNVGKCLELGYL